MAILIYSLCSFKDLYIDVKIVELYCLSLTWPSALPPALRQSPGCTTRAESGFWIKINYPNAPLQYTFNTFKIQMLLMFINVDLSLNFSAAFGSMWRGFKSPEI